MKTSPSFILLEIVKIEFKNDISKLFLFVVAQTTYKTLTSNRVIRKITDQTPVSILKEESEHQTHLCTKTRQKKIWTVV